MSIPIVSSLLRCILPCSLIVALCTSQELKVLENGHPTLVGTDIAFHADTPTRTKIDLSGTWSCTTDEERWMDIKVPSSMEFAGKMIFLRKFTVSEELLNLSAFKLVAFGINYEAEIYLNDIFVGKHTGGYASFEINIPEGVIQQGEENAIKIVVSNVLSAKTTLPLRKQIWGWKTYGGILRDIYLLATPRVWVESLAAKTWMDAEQRKGMVGLTVVVSNQGYPPIVHPDSVGPKSPVQSYQLTFDVEDVLAGTSASQTAPFTFVPENGKDSDVHIEFAVPNARQWAPDAPALYRVRATLSFGDAKKRTTIDSYTAEFGFVNVELRERSIVVNGKKTELKGVVWIEDSPVHGASLTYEEMEKDVALVKLLGANAIRFAFHQPHPYMISLCNRYGLFALEEIPAWNVPGELLGGEVFQTLAEQAMREMIERDRNNPSVLAWGIGDEFDSSDRRARGYAERLTAFAKSADRRPVYFGSRMLRNDLCVDVVDFAAASIATSDLKEFKESLAAWQLEHPRRPVLVTRYGRLVESGNHNGYSDPLSEEAQARFFLQCSAALREANVAGSFIHALNDWKGDRPILTTHSEDPYTMPVGLLDAAREKRMAYDVVKTIFAGQKVAALPIGKYRTTFPVVHIVAGFLIIFVIAYQYHYNRRFNESLKRAFLRSYNFFSDLRDVRTVSIFHTLLLTVIISLSLAVVLSSILYHYRTNVLADDALTQLVVSDLVKEFLIRATWNPLEGIAAFTGVFLVLSLLLTILIRFGALFVRSKIHLLHAYTVVVWASAPFIILSPLGMSLFKILQTPFYVLPSLIILFVFALWVSLRILKGVSVILDLSSLKTTIAGTVVAGALVALVATYFDSEYSFISYMQFLFHIMSGSS